MRDHKKIISLSIKDLKDLGIIKKRRKRRKGNKYFKKMILDNIKSSSDHMTGSSNSYNNMFTNTSNLQTENLALKNKNLLENSELNKINDSKVLELV